MQFFPMNPSKSFWAEMKLGKKVQGLAQAGDLPEKPVLVNLHNQHPASQEAPEFEVFSPATCSFYPVVIWVFG